jgi:hypothetical protein
MGPIGARRFGWFEGMGLELETPKLFGPHSCTLYTATSSRLPIDPGASRQPSRARAKRYGATGPSGRFYEKIVAPFNEVSMP